MRYAGRKLFTLLFTMVIVSFLTFAAFQLIPGDAATSQLGVNATQESVEALRHELGLDRPFLVQYGDWLSGFLTGDLGQSSRYAQPVETMVAPRIPVTLALSAMTFLLIVAFSVPLGLHSAGRVRRLDGAFTVVNQLLMALPPFFTGILLSWVFGILLKWFQPGGEFPDFAEQPGKFLWYLLFPAVSIAIPRIAQTVRVLRSTVGSEMRRDYVRTAISRGNNRQAVLVHHVLKNAMVPVVTFLAQTMAEVVAGSIVVEQVFGVPGLGRLLLSSISNRDWSVVQTIVVILALWVVLAGAVGDLVSQRLDPRLRLGGAR